MTNGFPKVALTITRGASKDVGVSENLDHRRAQDEVSSVCLHSHLVLHFTHEKWLIIGGTAKESSPKSIQNPIVRYRTS